MKLVLALAALFLTQSALGAQPSPGGGARPLTLQPCEVPRVERPVRCGVYSVPEDRKRPTGRMLPLKIMILPARSGNPAPDPLFMIFGGPGQSATAGAAFVSRSWMNENHDVVLVDQRGTGEGHSLGCRLSGSDEDLQGYLEPMFQLHLFRACRAELEKRADLTKYTTLDAVADLDEVRRALGFDRIFITGGSYGSRFVLEYLRRHGKQVKGAVISSVIPPSARNPLFHAPAAQRAFDGLVRECKGDPSCNAAYPNLAQDFETLGRRLVQNPAPVTVKHPASGEPAQLSLSHAAFGEAVRVMLYSPETARQLPYLITMGMKGDLAPFAEQALRSNRGLREQLQFGMLQSIVCSEDVPRIGPEDLRRVSARTFLGEARARPQIEACAVWPKAKLPRDFSTPVVSDVPVLLISGDLDPATPPAHAEEAAATLRNSLHLLVPGGHSPVNACITRVAGSFLRTGTVKGLDTSCTAEIRKPAFRLPAAG